MRCLTKSHAFFGAESPLAAPSLLHVAIVDIDNEVHGMKAMPAGLPVPPDGIIRTQLMEVFVRREGRWWIEAYHNVDTEPAN